MKYNEFKDELLKQINITAKFFKPGELRILNDFAETIAKENFEED